jgi:hypothetical protein
VSLTQSLGKTRSMKNLWYVSCYSSLSNVDVDHDSSSIHRCLYFNIEKNSSLSLWRTALVQVQRLRTLRSKSTPRVSSKASTTVNLNL